MDRIKPLGIPTIYGRSFGHIDQHLTFPIGAKATLNTTAISIVVKGPWVILFNGQLHPRRCRQALRH